MQVTKLRCYLPWQKYDILIADIRSNRSSLIFSFPIERLNKGEINAIYIPQSVFSLLFLKRLKLKSTNSQNHLNLVKPRFFFSACIERYKKYIENSAKMFSFVQNVQKVLLHKHHIFSILHCGIVTYQ